MMVALFGAGLAACGGGSVSSGGGGTGSGANLVVQLNGNGTASLQTGPGLENRMVATLSDLLVRKAMAGVDGQTVCLYDSTNALLGCKTTDTSGKAYFFVDPADGYTACFGESSDPVDTPSMCIGGINVSEGDLVVATVDCTITAGTEQCALTSAVNSPIVDNTQAFQDPQNSRKVIICHKPDSNNPRTLSVSQDALPAHLAHGDDPGACPAPGPGKNGVDASGDNRGPKNGNGPQNGNGPKNGNEGEG